jgi:hypothetical protein
MNPPLHGGGQGFESPRLHFQGRRQLFKAALFAERTEGRWLNYQQKVTDFHPISSTNYLTKCL